jgi:hypothetical protein
MAWQLQLGIDIDLLKKADPNERDRQIRMLSLLSIMLIVIGIISTISAVVFLVIIFHNWLIAIGGAIFIGMVAFNLYRLLVMTAMDATGTILGEYLKNHELHIFEQVSPDAHFENISDQRLLDMAANAKEQLREKPLLDRTKKGIDFSTILTMMFRVMMLSVLALIFATGLEILIFKDQINQVLEQMKTLYHQTGDTWMVEQMLTPLPDDEFYLIHTNSLLLVLDVLNEGMGYWKLVMDLIFLILFLIPLAIVFRSKELAKGVYIKEWALSSITISYYHHLITQKYCSIIKTRIAELRSGHSADNQSAKQSDQ